MQIIKSMSCAFFAMVAIMTGFAQAEQIKLMQWGVSGGSVTHAIAWQNGFFKQNNLEVTMVYPRSSEFMHFAKNDPSIDAMLSFEAVPEIYYKGVNSTWAGEQLVLLGVTASSSSAIYTQIPVEKLPGAVGGLARCGDVENPDGTEWRDITKEGSRTYDVMSPNKGDALLVPYLRSLIKSGALSSNTHIVCGRQILKKWFKDGWMPKELKAQNITQDHIIFIEMDGKFGSRVKKFDSGVYSFVYGPGLAFYRFPDAKPLIGAAIVYQRGERMVNSGIFAYPSKIKGREALYCSLVKSLTAANQLLLAGLAEKSGNGEIVMDTEGGEAFSAFMNASYPKEDDGIKSYMPALLNIKNQNGVGNDEMATKNAARKAFYELREYVINPHPDMAPPAGWIKQLASVYRISELKYFNPCKK